MTTFLGALRFAVNIEAELSDLQRTRFTMTGDTSTRLLPPIIPIATLTAVPAEHHLDRFRKGHFLMYSGPSEGVSTPEPRPPAGYSLFLEGFEALQHDLVRLFDGAVSGEPFFPEGRSPSGTPVLRLGWSSPPIDRTPPPLPRTAAFWLAIFEVRFSNDDPWWNGARWWLRYSRRLTSRRESPDSARPASHDTGRHRPLR